MKLCDVIIDGYNVICDGVAGSGKTTAALMACMKTSRRVVYLHRLRPATLLESERFAPLLVSAKNAHIRFHTLHAWMGKCTGVPVGCDADLQVALTGALNPKMQLPHTLIVDDVQCLTCLQVEAIKAIVTLAGVRVQCIILGDSLHRSTHFLQENAWKSISSFFPWSMHSLKESHRLDCNMCSVISSMFDCTVAPTLARVCSSMENSVVTLSTNLFRPDVAVRLIEPYLSNKCVVMCPFDEYPAMRRCCMNIMNCAIGRVPSLRVYAKDGSETALSVEAMRSKLLIWSFSQGRGIESEVVIVLWAGELCEELYTAATRARQRLILVEHSGGGMQKKPPLCSVTRLSETCRFDRDWIRLVEPEVGLHPVCTVARFPTHSEDVSAIYGMAIALKFEHACTGALHSVPLLSPIFIDSESSAKQLFEEHGLSWTGSDANTRQIRHALNKMNANAIADRIYTKDEFYNRISHQDHGRAIQLANSNSVDPVCFVELASILHSFDNHRGVFTQIRSFEWVDSAIVNNAVAILERLIHVLDIQAESGEFEKPLAYGKIRGRCDIVFPDIACELKFTYSLTHSHRSQALLYASILAIRKQTTCSALLVNTRSSQVEICTVNTEEAYDIIARAYL